MCSVPTRLLLSVLASSRARSRTRRASSVNRPNMGPLRPVRLPRRAVECQDTSRLSRAARYIVKSELGYVLWLLTPPGDSRQGWCPAALSGAGPPLLDAERGVDPRAGVGLLCAAHTQPQGDPERLTHLGLRDDRRRAAIAAVRERDGGRRIPFPNRGECLLDRSVLVEGRNRLVDDPQRPYDLETIVERSDDAALLHHLLLVVVDDDNQVVGHFGGGFHHANVADVKWIKVTADNTDSQHCGRCRWITFTLAVVHEELHSECLIREPWQRPGTRAIGPGKASRSSKSARDTRRMRVEHFSVGAGGAANTTLKFIAT